MKILSKLSLKTLPTEKVQYLCEVSGTTLTGHRFEKDDLRVLLLSLNCTPLSEELLQPVIDNVWTNMIEKTRRNRKRQKRREQRGDDEENSEASTDGGRPDSVDSEDGWGPSDQGRNHDVPLLARSAKLFDCHVLGPRDF